MQSAQRFTLTKEPMEIRGEGFVATIHMDCVSEENARVSIPQIENLLARVTERKHGLPEGSIVSRIMEDDGAGGWVQLLPEVERVGYAG